MNMKNIIKLALLLVAASIIFSSCSQTSTTSLTKSYNRSSINIEHSAKNNTETMNEETHPYQVKGYSSVNQEMNEENYSITENKTPVSIVHSLFKGNVQSNNKNQKNIVANYNHPDTKDINSNTTEISRENRDIPSITQSANYAGHSSGNSSNGVPKWLIVVCSIVIPPLGVALMYGICDKFWIDLALTFCFWLPGMIYALILVL
jgi:uncharacterized membrane protein YqaE (UPF0057 family)